MTRVIAETLPELLPSIGVLEKTGFEQIDGGSEPGVLRYEYRKSGCDMVIAEEKCDEEA